MSKDKMSKDKMSKDKMSKDKMSKKLQIHLTPHDTDKYYIDARRRCQVIAKQVRLGEVRSG
jgi:hypothetical protein